MAASGLEISPSTPPVPGVPPPTLDPQEAQKALLSRPEVSLRSRVVVVFLVLFALCTAMTVAGVVFLNSFESRIGFLENAQGYSFEIEEARRNEKNFFLYGTGLPEALASAGLARDYLERDSVRIRSVVGAAAYRNMKTNLDEYESLLRSLTRSVPPSNLSAQQQIEATLRAEGARLLQDAEGMIARERSSVGSMLRTSRVAAVAFLALMLLTMVLFGSYVIRAVLEPLKRFTAYAGRVGSGNFEPIQPTRKYRDEYSRLALAFNQMIAELQARQNQLLQTGKMAAVGTLTSGIAHELNNPLNNIGLTVESLMEDFSEIPDEAKLHMLDQVYTQFERASATVRNLLDFTRKGRTAFARMSVESAVCTARRLVSNESKLNDIEWKVDLPEDLPQVMGHPHDLQQVFLNLFLNAIQAMPSGGTLSVQAVPIEERWVRIDVADTGVGIPPEALEQIFDPFFTTKDPGKGTGLGLSVSHGIIGEHGGRLEVESTLGEGTTFRVFLSTTHES